MKHFYIVTFIASLLMVSIPAQASTVLSATDGDMNFYNADNIFSPIPFDLFLFDDSTSINNSLNPADGLSIALPSITGILGPVGGNFIATNSGGDTLVLTGSNQFILGLYDGNNNTWLVDSGFVPINSANGVALQFFDPASETAVSILVVDAVTTVPLPGAAWLFLTGLMGIAGFSHRRNS